MISRLFQNEIIFIAVRRRDCAVQSITMYVEIYFVFPLFYNINWCRATFKLLFWLCKPSPMNSLKTAWYSFHSSTNWWGSIGQLLHVTKTNRFKTDGTYASNPIHIGERWNRRCWRYLPMSEACALRKNRLCILHFHVRIIRLVDDMGFRKKNCTL